MDQEAKWLVEHSGDILPALEPAPVAKAGDAAGPSRISWPLMPVATIGNGLRRAARAWAILTRVRPARPVGRGPSTKSSAAPIPVRPRSKVICRPILPSDLDAVTDLLVRGFPERNRRYWIEGFERQRRRAMPPEWPRFGVMLESDRLAVGVILMLFTSTDAGVRCNLSSWHVDPAFKVHAATLVLHALRHKHVVYTNISPVLRTIPSVVAVGFRRYTGGQFFSVPALNRSEEQARIHILDPDAPPDAYADVPHRDVLVDHAAMNCISLVVEAADGLHPFVFLPYRIASGRYALPGQQLVFCKDLPTFVRFAGIIGRALMRRGAFFVVHDALDPTPGLAGVFRRQVTGRYYRGATPPRLGDLAYSERVIFGP